MRTGCARQGMAGQRSGLTYHHGSTFVTRHLRHLLRRRHRQTHPPQHTAGPRMRQGTVSPDATHRLPDTTAMLCPFYPLLGTLGWPPASGERTEG